MSGITGYQSMLLGAQAAGIGADLYSAYSKKKIADAGLELEKGDINIRKGQEELSYAEANLASLQELQEVMATQRAIMGARGQNPGVGSSLASANKSERAHGADQRARELSKTFRQSQLDGMSRLLNIKKAGNRAAFGGSLIESSLNSLSLNKTIGEFIQDNKKSIKTFNNDKSSSAGPFKDKNPYKGAYSLKGSIYG